VLSSQEIVKELEWIISQWDLRLSDDGPFKVTFPSKADLARMTKFINVMILAQVCSFTSRSGQMLKWTSFISHQFGLSTCMLL
jgi:hypothetical protein